MVRKKVVDYIRGLLQRGYDISTIRNTMLKYGYTNKDIDSAVNEIYHPTIRHEIHLSKTTIIFILFIFASLVGLALFFYYPSKQSTKLLDLNLEPIVTSVAAGDYVVFLKELSNLGSAKRYDVVIKQEIIEQNTNKAITQKIETRAIETFGSTQTRILVPQDTKPGNYILRATVDYDNKRAVATLPIKIVESSKAEETQPIECDDNNHCTIDVVENNICVNKPITPCCGNNVCEENEESCADCKKTSLPALISTETLEEIKELARIEPSKALQQCNTIEVPNLKDTCIANIGEVQRNKIYCSQIINVIIRDSCYSNIAKSLNDNTLCEEISTDGRKDSCYMTFVLDNKDYSICEKIINKQIRQSCESLRQLDELNKLSSQQELENSEEISS